MTQEQENIFQKLGGMSKAVSPMGDELIFFKIEKNPKKILNR
jgi:hypothetical protein